MRRATTTPGMRRLRFALLAAIALVVGGVAALFVLGRTSRPAPEIADEPGVVEETRPAADEVAVLSEGFDYEQQVAGKPVFRLHGDRFTTDRGGQVSLDGVRLVLYREGEPLEVVSRTATYDPETRDAELEGDVVVRGGGGWELRGARLDLQGEANVIASREGTIAFRRGEHLRGTARRLRYRIDDQVLTLSGAVEIEGERASDGRAMQVRAESVTWKGESGTMAAQGDVVLTSARDVIRSERLTARLGEDGGGLESALADGEVVGSLYPDSGGRLEFEGERAAVEFDPQAGSPSVVSLVAERRWEQVLVVFGGEGTTARKLTAPAVRLAFAAGRPSEVLATRGVLLTEEGEGVERSAAGEELTATLDASGDLASARLAQRVRLVEAGWTVVGNELELADGGSRATVRGRPARASGERGTLEAPTLRFERAAQKLDAGQGVRATFRPAAAPFAAGEEKSAAEPVGIESLEATFYEATRRFEFRGDVRAAQGDSLLFADRLEGDDAATVATGHVRTQWTDRRVVAAGGSPELTVITADRLDYERGKSEARYMGKVAVRQNSRDIAADDLLIELDDRGSARRMLANGSVRIEDRASGRSVAGASADYDLEAGQAIVLGEPVILREASGTTLRGRRALFDQRTGSSRLLSEAP